MGVKEFRGRHISVLNGYPAVWWPEHPQAMANGSAYIHRIIGYEKYGPLNTTDHIHHQDENRWNWDSANLEKLSRREHRYRHTLPERRIEVCCAQCRLSFTVKPWRFQSSRSGDLFCTRRCEVLYRTESGARSWIQWPSDEELLHRLATEFTTAIAAYLGVSDTAVVRHAKAAARRQGVSFVKKRQLRRKNKMPL